jgi:hypothetical protein
VTTSTGIQGYTGSLGDTGYTGSQGIGFTGSQGIGFTGSTGNIGFTGSQGIGYTGSQGIGFTGSQGIGYTGSQGIGFTGSTGNIGFTGSQGIGFTGSTGNTGSLGYTGSSGGGDTGNFTFSGNTMTVPTNGIIRTPDDKTFRLQAKDLDSLLRNEIEIDPNNGTYMSVWSGELDATFSTSDWATGTWENLEGVPGISGAFFTNAENLQDFWTTGAGSFVNSVEVSINGGPRLPVSYDGNNGETYGALLLVIGVPATSPTTITSLVFYYRTQSKINIDYDGGEIRLDGQALNINLQTTSGLNLQSGQTLDIKNIGQQPVRIFTDNITHTWEFDSAGSLTLPVEGRISGIGTGPGGDRYGYITWAGNTSGDGLGYNTMRLVPDLQGLEDADQYIILDPTSPGHIHIRAGGTQDNSQAILFFGGENSHVKIDSGPNPPVTISANNNSWTFGTSNGGLTFPDSTVQTTAYTGNVAGFAIGYRDVPQNFTNTSYTFDTSDAGKHILTQNSGTSSQILTIANNATVPFRTGAAISIVVQSTGTVALANGAGVTMFLAGNSSAMSTVNLNSYSMATILKIGTDTWFVSGTGAT